MSIQCWTVHAKTIINVTVFKHFCSTGVSSHLSFVYKYIHTQGNLLAHISLHAWFPLDRHGIMKLCDPSKF